MSTRAALVAGALAAALGVAAGAFGAHALQDMVPAERLATWRTGASYAQVHALALVLVGVLGTARPALRLGAVAGLFAAGLVLFSGSLFALVLLDAPWLGAVTPLGGVAWIAGWGLLAWRAARSPDPRASRQSLGPPA